MYVYYHSNCDKQCVVYVNTYLKNYFSTGLKNNSTYTMDKKLMNFLGNFFSVIHRLIEFIGRWIFLLAAYLTGPPEMPPPIENKNITMRSLNELSIMIRQKKVS